MDEGGAEGLPEVFPLKPGTDAEAARIREKDLFEEIGRLKMELERLNLPMSSVEGRRRMIKPDHPAMPITRQSELLG